MLNGGGRKCVFFSPEALETLQKLLFWKLLFSFFSYERASQGVAAASAAYKEQYLAGGAQEVAKKYREAPPKMDVWMPWMDV